MLLGARLALKAVDVTIRIDATPDLDKTPSQLSALTGDKLVTGSVKMVLFGTSAWPTAAAVMLAALPAASRAPRTSTPFSLLLVSLSSWGTLELSFKEMESTR